MKLFILPVLSTVLLSSGAYAADLMIQEAPPINDYASAGAFYASVFGGIVMINDIDYDSTAGDSGVLSLDNGYSVDIALGHDFGNGLRLEGQLGYLNANLTGATYGVDEFDATGSASALYVMANAWYGIDMGGITPFIGGGVGFANLTLDSDFAAPYDAADFNETQGTYAWQVGAGVSVAVTDNLDLTARYRYFATGDVTMTDGQGDDVTASMDAHIIDVGLTASF